MIDRFASAAKRARGSHLVGALALSASLAAAAACTGSQQVSTVPPLTGIRVDASSVFGVDGCGEGASQVTKYIVTVAKDFAPTDSGAAEQEMLVGRVFDCFVDATFLDLPLPADETVQASYALRVFGYSADNPELDVAAAAVAVTPPAEDVGEQLEPAATLAATCTATQQRNLRTTAVCTIDFDNRAKSAGDGGIADASDDASPDAAEDDAGDGGDEPDDAGEPDDADSTDAGDATTDGAP